MARNRKTAFKLDLTSIMDIFTTLVFFLLVNQSGTEVLEAPKNITLPASTTENKPRETVVIFISPSDVTVQGESVVTPDAVMAAETTNIPPIAARLSQLRSQVIGTSTKAIADSQEVTILADRNRAHQVGRAAQELGMTVLPGLIDTTGLQVWNAE